ncbi:MAG: hypothetical protein ABI895_00765 [Deltaproteobacteria bacterium]
MFMFLDEGGRAIGTVDVSFGSPRAGVVELGSESDHLQQVERRAGVPYFSGSAALTELLLRRCVRGKSLDEKQVAYSRRLWSALPVSARDRFRRQLERRFGSLAAGAWIDALSNEDPFPWWPLRRSTLLGVVGNRPSLLAEYGLDKSLYDRRPRQRDRYAGGARPSATTVAIIGTDGTGKSSLVRQLSACLREFGLDSTTLYFGRVRGGVLMSDRIRKWGERVFRPTSIADSTSAEMRAQVPATERVLRYLASYAYVFDYASRLAFRVLPLLARGQVIVFDRYVYDLRFMPHASKLAARAAEGIAPRPQLVFFLDVDPNVILSRRQERALPEILKQQATLRSVCERIGSRTRCVTVSSSASVQELALQLTRAAIAVAHRRELGVPGLLTELLDDVQRRLSTSGSSPPPALSGGVGVHG